MIFVECKPDTLLVKYLASSSERRIIHSNGKSGVCKALTNNNNCIGVVDEDPWSNQPKYLKNLRENNDHQEYGINLLLDADRDNKVIVIRPRLEEWIIQAAEKANVNLDGYKLPSDGEGLHDIINKNLEKFERLLEELKSTEDLMILSALLRNEPVSAPP